MTALVIEDEDKYESDYEDNNTENEQMLSRQQQEHNKSRIDSALHRKCCCCINIYKGMYLINSWNIFISFPCIAIGFARLYIHVIFPYGIETFFYALWVFICYILIVCLRIFGAFTGFSLIPALKNQNLEYSAINSSEYYEKQVLMKYEIKSRIYCWLLLWSPMILYFLLLIEVSAHYYDFQNIVILSVLFLYFIELFVSSYFYYVISRFINDKWNMEIWACPCKKSCYSAN